jgi:hypothetical protein
MAGEPLSPPGPARTARTARPWLLGAAALLAVTAVFHATGFFEARGWVGGRPGDFVALLWIVPTIDWLVLAAIWAYAAFRGTAAMRVVLYMTTIIPVAVAIAMLVAIGFHPGVLLLAASAVLARIGILRLT